MKIFRNFSAAVRRAERADSKGVLEMGKGGSFVEQDKGPAVRYGIFLESLNELVAFPRWRRS